MDESAGIFSATGLFSGIVPGSVAEIVAETVSAGLPPGAQ